MHAQSQFWAIKTDMQHPCYSLGLYARAALAWTKRTFTNVITLGKLLGLLFLFHPLLLSNLSLKTPKIQGKSS